MPPIPSQIRTRKWVFTWNNPDDLTLPGLLPDIKYLICQYEAGESGTPHVQGFVWFTRVKRFSAVRKFFNTHAHWAPARGSAESNMRYCSKEEGRIAGPWSIGDLPHDNGHSSSNDYKPLQKDLDEGMTLTEVSTQHFELYLKHRQSIQQYRLQQMAPRDFKTEVTFLFGPPNAGKTYYVSQKDPDYWRKPLSHWFDRYDGQATVLYDDFLSTAYGSITGHLAAFDKGKYEPKVHFGFCQWRPRHVYITCNMTPEELFPKLQLEKPALVHAFWDRIENIIKFEPRESLDGPAVMTPVQSMWIAGKEWKQGFKRGH